MSRQPPPPKYTPELEYTVDLGTEGVDSTPPLDGAAPARTRSWRPTGQEREQKARSTAYDAAGNLKVAVRSRRAAERDCGICAQVAVEPVRTQCCDALFCKDHIDQWLRSPAATGLCPACDAPCVLRPSSSAASPEASEDVHQKPARNNTTSKYTHPGADALLRLLAVFVALVLLIGALIRRSAVEE
ncbi:hypothetical protein B0H19DRAFT_1160579 [Mycena capillaripes]|nr:hypothetical protein B0H19DRAFT_1160579 [Mycena capillaripes]